jgi:predicted transcriptional regulator
VRRGVKDQAADFLEEVIQKHDLPPTRICARVGVNWAFVDLLAGKGLIELEAKTERRNRVSITDKGREFLTHYRVCNQLLPC